MYTNQILNTDSYKFSHFKQYPPEVRYVTAYIEARKSEQDIMFFGLQMYLKEYMGKPLSMADIKQAEPIIKAHGLPFNREGFERIVNEHSGYWPVRIQALPEGTVHKAGIPQVQVTNTDPKLPWVTTFIETALLRAVWYPSNVASLDLGIKRGIKSYLEKTADNSEGLGFKLHDFGARGVSSNESAGIGGCAHLVNFLGTDTVMGLVYAMNYYGAPVSGFSIPAAEHSTIISWGRERETDAYRNMLKQFAGPRKLVAVVSDSYDIWNAVNNIWGSSLKEEVINQGGTIVIRPDSGDPTKVPAQIMWALGNAFGYTTNSKGYKMLPPFLRVIQGDGVNACTIAQCLYNLSSEGWSADNIAFGMGGEMLQKHNRDTFYYAMKPNAVSADGVSWTDVSKSPIGDPQKLSKAGRQAVVRTNEGLRAVREDNQHWDDENLLRPVWDTGKLLVDDSFEAIRKRASSSIS